MLKGKYKEDFNCRHCELAYKRVKEWAEKLKMNYQTLRGRLKKGWSFEDAITIPIRKFSKKDIQEVE